jgi:hypothetical protein
VLVCAHKVNFDTADEKQDLAWISVQITTLPLNFLLPN